MTSDPTTAAMLQDAVTHVRAGRLDLAAAIARAVVDRNPNHADAVHLLGTIAHMQGRLDEALRLIVRSIQLNPAVAGYYTNLGDVCRTMNRPQDAIAAFRRAVELSPGYAEGYNNLSVILQEEGRYQEAMDCSRRAIAMLPDNAVAHNNLGAAIQDQNRFADVDEMIAMYRRALQLQPDYAAAHSNMLLAMQYDAKFDADTIAREHRAWDAQQAARFRSEIRPHGNSRDPDRKLKIGLVSADLKLHPVGFFIASFLPSLDRGRFHLTAYSDVAMPDTITAQLAQSFDHWQNIRGLRDDEVADRIRADEIDILIDLAGHTAGHRLLVFARKPAPIQITYLGYPDTTGMAAMDYRIVDNFTDPPGAEKFSIEKLLRLDPCFLCFPANDAPPPGDRGGPITFASLNKFPKVTAPMIEVWAKILHAVPGSRLLLKARSLTDDVVRTAVSEQFASHGISTDRLDIRSWASSLESHLQTYDEVDIALDTFPYHGTTTTCEAMWMGVPVVTLAGRTHRSRVGVSILNNVGLPELVAESSDDYIRIAMKLANDRSRLRELRQTLRDRMQRSPLMDAPAFARRFESALRNVWCEWCRQGDARA